MKITKIVFSDDKMWTVIEHRLLIHVKKRAFLGQKAIFSVDTKA